MIAIWFAQNQNINLFKRKKYIRDLRRLSLDIKSILNNKNNIDSFLKLFENKNSCFILGKECGEAIAHEGSLKIKEISYIHSEAYSSSSLKHGPFALLEKNFPVILIAPKNEYYSKNMNAYEEIKSRYANIILITDNEDVNFPYIIKIPKNEIYANLLCIIPLQLLALKLSIQRGFNPDMPRNLAKVVTVE
jgi:glucosamine--fructose-6-phosphate aminotransferase (isomerizing)